MRFSFRESYSSTKLDIMEHTLTDGFKLLKKHLSISKEDAMPLHAAISLFSVFQLKQFKR
jgi:hypothetical protein